MTLAELKSLCVKYHLNPSKQYGQNYLISDAPIKKMIVAAELSPDDTVMEIGPGFGILTFGLAPLVKKVIAFEIEKKLLSFWEAKQKEFPNIEIVWGNAIDRIGNYELGIMKYKVIANLPYQITSRLLRTLLEMENKPERIIIMAQKEVAERICAKPGDMSMLAVAVQYYGEPKIIAKVSRGNFWPSPRVDSAVLRIQTYKHSNIQTLKHKNIKTFADKLFFHIVRAGFANKRKQLWHNLASRLSLEKETVKNVLKEAVGNEKIRAEDLGVDDWLKIVDKLPDLPTYRATL